MKLFDREVFFDHVKSNPFDGSLTQDQVDGMDAILDAWEEEPRSDDLRWLAYPMATAAHETGMEMQPIEEYGKGEGMEYGKKDPETDQVYYGRGYVQTTWRENYARADKELGLMNELSCEWHAENQLDAQIAAETMFQGMVEGWFRTHDDGDPENLARYFNDDTDDPYQAREIINGDKSKVPSWSGGVSIGNLIVGYHNDFLAALEAARLEKPEEEVEGGVSPEEGEHPPSVPIHPPVGRPAVVYVRGDATVKVRGKVLVILNGKPFDAA